jgi:hypothetical protein
MTQVAAATKTNLFALIGFIAAFLIPVVGIVFGAIATRQIRDTGEGGRGLSRAAIIIGIAGAVFQLAFFIVWLTLFFSTFRMGTAG